MKNKINFLFVLALLLLSCEPDWVDTWDAWEIKKDHYYSHRSGLPRRIVPSIYSGKTMHFSAYFTESCKVDVNGDLNKLYGFSDCNSQHLKNSARFAWRWNGSAFEVYSYVYANGVRHFTKMGTTQAYVKDEYSITVGDDYYFQFNENTVTEHRHKDCESGIRYRLFPYFGGDDRAPQDITIFIHEYD